MSKVQAIKHPIQPQVPSAKWQMINILGKTQMTQVSQVDANTTDQYKEITGNDYVAV